MRTFELKLILVAKTDKALEHIEDIKHMILSGELQREWIDSGKYHVKIGIYEYEIFCHGYYAPDKCVWWEAANLKTNEADFHEHTKRRLIQTMREELSAITNGR